MSTPPSPHFAHLDVAHTKRRDRPPALAFSESKTSSDGETRSDRDAAGRASDQVTHPSFDRRDSRLTTTRRQPRLHVFGVADHERETTDSDLPRSASATSSLDPYYFGVRTPSESPVPTTAMPRFMPKTPENGPVSDPVTPGKDPASIDRRGLVGVGELATPRWARGERRDEIEIDDTVDELDEDELVVAISEQAVDENGEQRDEDDLPDSPWTIEAIDGEGEEEEEVSRCSSLLNCTHAGNVGIYSVP